MKPMKALLLNGAQDTSLDAIHGTIVDELKNRKVEVSERILRDIEIADCMGCFGCWIKTPGECLIDDAGREVARAVVQNDLTVYLTPVTFGGYSAELKKALDRLIPVILPFFTRIDGEVHHKRRYQGNPRLAAVGVLDGPDEQVERLFATLVKRNAINMHSLSHGVGAVYTSEKPQKIRNKIKTILLEAGVR